MITHASFASFVVGTADAPSAHASLAGFFGGSVPAQVGAAAPMMLIATMVLACYAGMWSALKRMPMLNHWKKPAASWGMWFALAWLGCMVMFVRLF